MSKTVLYIIIEDMVTDTTMLQNTLFEQGFTWGSVHTNIMEFSSRPTGSTRIRLDLIKQSMSFYTLRTSNVSDSEWITYTNRMYDDTSMDTLILRYGAFSITKIMSFINHGSVVNYEPRTIIKTI